MSFPRGQYSSEGKQSLHSPELLADLHRVHQGMEKMQAQKREAVCWPGINADIANYVHRCTICTRPLHWLSQCSPDTSLMVCGRRSQLTTCSTKVKSACLSAVCSASTPSYQRLIQIYLFPSPETTRTYLPVQTDQPHLHR